MANQGWLTILYRGTNFINKQKAKSSNFYHEINCFKNNVGKGLREINGFSLTQNYIPDLSSRGKTNIKDDTCT